MSSSRNLKQQETQPYWRRAAATLAFIVLLGNISPCFAPQDGPCGNTPLYARQGSEQSEVKSPDGRTVVKVDVINANGIYVRYRVETEGREFSLRMKGFGAEILWAPDSSRFAVNQAEGGGGFGQRAYVISVNRKGLRKTDVSSPIEKAFGSPVKCEVRVPPNTAVVQWLDSKNVLVVAEIVNVSVCRYPGTFRAYKLSLPTMRVLKSYEQVEAKRRFAGALGCELLDADDARAARWQ